MQKALRIIHLEDDPNDRELIQSILEADGISCKFRPVETRDEFLAALEEVTPDLIMSDFTLPAYDGLSAMALAREKLPNVPYLFVSGTMGEELAVDSLQCGATDYVLKHRLNRLVPAVRRALREAEQRRLREQAEVLKEAFLDLGNQLNSATTPKRAARIILDAAQRLMQWDACSLDLNVPERNATRPVLALENVLGRCLDNTPEPALIPLVPFAIRCLNEGGILIPSVEAPSQEEAPGGSAERRLCPSSLLASVRHGKRTIGFLSLQKRSLPSYTEDDLKTLLALADHCGGALERIAIVAEKDLLFEELRTQQHRLDKILAGIPAVVWEFWHESDTEHPRANFVSRRVEQMIGYSVREWLDAPDLWLRIVHPEDRQRVHREIDALRQTRKELTHQFRWIAKDGRTVWVETSAAVACRSDGTPIGLRGVSLDITDKKRIETQLLRSQRIESIGRLTSGIAHNLNNALTPVLMSAGVLREQLANPELRDLISMNETHAQRAADIVRQLLTFARGQECERAPIHPTVLLNELLQTINHTFPKSIDVTSNFRSDLWMIEGNPTQLHQVLLNLCVNARDAMPDGGALTISAANTVLDDEEAGAFPDAEPGPYVAIGVIDTGTGIATEILNDIFDPFFTTKGPMQGTGLGLSTVLRIVRNWGGFVAVESAPGAGSRFEVYFPASVKSDPRQPRQEVSARPVGAGETILVVEDEPGIREVARQILADAGFNVILAGNGAEAIQRLDEQSQTIQVVLTDIMMPVMDGVALTQVIRRIKPRLKIIATSGFGTEDKLTALRALGVNEFLEKPFSRDTLILAIHNAIHPQELS